ncbi:MAG: antibiotic biosynthesis monooxygenase [Clostridia bacterium]|nr:antibiotic biosynthesis monooxygenase [Clostridia bacterium]
MSITFNIYYKGKQGRAKQFVEEMMSRGLISKIRAEEGNERYEYFISLADKEIVLLIDSWSSQDALDKHHSSPMMSEIARLREKYDLSMKVEKYIPVEENLDDRKYLRKNDE